MVVLTLPEDQPKLFSSYIGDSGYLIFKFIGPKLEIKYESKPQQKRFNFPYQLGWRGNGDTPNSALVLEHDLEEGDIIVAGSDGIFDNMTSENIAQVLELQLQFQNFDPWDLSKKLANAAFKLSLDKNHKSPFFYEAKKYGYLSGILGGKSDDIAVVVARVQSSLCIQNF